MDRDSDEVSSFVQSFAREIAQFDVSPCLEFFQDEVNFSDLANKDYLNVIRKLRAGANANLSLDVPIYDMTGLENSVYRLDSRMFVVFFMAGADPGENVFNGIIQTQASFHGVGDPLTCPSFRGEDGEYRPIPGFAGLRCILQEFHGEEEADDDNDNDLAIEDEKVGAALWLAEKLHDKSICLDPATIDQTRTNLRRLESDFDWEGTFVSDGTFAVLFLAKLGDVKELPVETTRAILDFVLPGMLLDAIQKCFDDIIASVGTVELSHETNAS
jgi:hypothetical protein